MLDKNEIRDLTSKISGLWVFNAPMASYTTLKVGGPAEILIEAENEQDVSLVVDYAKKTNTPLTILGNGSNLLVLDGGLKGIVLRLGGNFKKIKVLDNKITAGAAAILPKIARAAASHGLTGLEFAIGIPASLGGAVVMNAGVPEQALSDVISSVQTISQDGNCQSFINSELGFSYRHSNINPQQEIVLSAELTMEHSEEEKIRLKMEEYLNKRKASQPLGMPNAGSIFKNPTGYAAGYLIDQAGLKGLTNGGARISTRHANFIINEGHASAKDVLNLILLAQKCVLNQFGVELVPEIKIVGEEN